MSTWGPADPIGARARTRVRYPSLPAGMRVAANHEREWRNWQTRTVQVRVPERAWGFKSPLAHDGRFT